MDDNQIEKYISIGKYEDALNNLKLIEKERILSTDEDLLKKYVLSFISLDKGDFEKGIRIADKLIKEAYEENNILGEINGIIAKTENTSTLGLFKESLKLIEEGELILKNCKNIFPVVKKQKQAYLIYLKGRIYRDTHYIFDAIKFLKKSYKLRKEINDKVGMMWSLLNLASIINVNGNFKSAERYFNESLTIAEELNIEEGITWNLIYFGWLKYHQRDLTKAISYAKRCLSICEPKNYNYPNTRCYDLIGHCYLLKGKLNTALLYFEKSLNIREIEGYKQMLPVSYYSIGLVYCQKGEFKRSLSYYEKTLELLDLEVRELVIPVYLNAIGKVYGEINNFQAAKEHLLEALNILEKNEIPLFQFLNFNVSITSTLHNLILLSVNNNDLKNVKNYLEKIHKISMDNPDIKQFDHLYHLDKAIILKSKNRLMDKMEAVNILENIIKEEIIDHEITVEAMKNLCEILLYELELSGDKDILREIEALSERLLEISRSEYLYDLLAETYFFKAKISLLNLETQKARLLLTKAQNIANEHDLIRLASKISNEHDSLLKNLDEWEIKIKQSESLKDILHNKKDDFLFIKKDLSDNNKESKNYDIPVYFIIINNINAEYLYNKAFQNINIDNASLIAGYISAINIFGKETFSSSGTISRIKHGEYLTILQLKKEFLFGYVYKGYSYSAISKLNNFIQSLSKATNDLENITIDFEKYLKLPEGISITINNLVNEIFLENKN